MRAVQDEVLRVACCRDQTVDGDGWVVRRAGRVAARLGNESLEPPSKSDLRARILRQHPSREVWLES